jgi:hypothetical protein
MIRVEQYIGENGECPYRQWFDSLDGARQGIVEGSK